jgi:hypothetical protein
MWPAQSGNPGVRALAMRLARQRRIDEEEDESGGPSGHRRMAAG